MLVATAGAGWALGVDAMTFAVSAALLVGLRRVGLGGRLGGHGMVLEDLR